MSDPTAAPPSAQVEDFQDFVAARGTHLYRTACLLTGGDTQLAEDLVQETLGRMYAVRASVRRTDAQAPAARFSRHISAR